MAHFKEINIKAGKKDLDHTVMLIKNKRHTIKKELVWNPPMMKNKRRRKN